MKDLRKLAHALGKMGVIKFRRQYPALTQVEIEELRSTYGKDVQHGQKDSGFASKTNIEDSVGNLQMRGVKLDTHVGIRTDLEELYGGATTANKLRMITMPASGWMLEQSLLDSDTALGGNIGEFIGIEHNPEIVPAVRRTARFLRREHPGTKFAVHFGKDRDLFTPGVPRAKYLRPEEGINAIWLDWMTNWNVTIEKTLMSVMADLQIFHRAWQEGLPGLLYITLQVGHEDSWSMNMLKNSWRASPVIRPVGKLADQGLMHYSIRSCGLAALLEQQAFTHGMRCEQIRQFYYMDRSIPSVRHALMWFSGFRFWPAGNSRRPSMKVGADFVGVTPHRR